MAGFGELFIIRMNGSFLAIRLVCRVNERLRMTGSLIGIGVTRNRGPGPGFLSTTKFKGSSNQTFQRMVLKTGLIAKKPFLSLKNRSYL
jgi:hypothetical protein